MEIYTLERKIGRVRLQKPVPAVADGERAYVVDASVHGVRISHTGFFPHGTKHDVEFEWDGRPIRFEGEIRWTRADRGPSRAGVYQSGLEISNILTDSETALRGLVEHCVERVLREQRANAHGLPPRDTSLDKREDPSLYTRHELVNGAWRKIATADPHQPQSGFTVPVAESRTQVEMLRSAYEVADTSMRQVIQRLARLSIEEHFAAWRRNIP